MWFIVYLAIAIVVALFSREYVMFWLYERDRKAHACGSLPVDFNRPFGLGNIREVVGHIKNGTLLNWIETGFVQNNQPWTSMRQTVFQLTIFTAEPENMKAILSTQFKEFGIGLRKPHYKPLLGNSLLTQDGPTWKHSRAIMRPLFTKESISNSFPIYSRHSNELVAKVEELNKAGKLFNVCQLIERFAMDVVTDVLFAKPLMVQTYPHKKFTTKDGKVFDFDELMESMEECFDFLSERSRSMHLYHLIYSPRFNKDVKMIHNFTDALLDDALANNEKETNKSAFAVRLVDAFPDKSELRNQLFTLLLAGKDTSSNTLCYIIYELSKQPKLWKRLREYVLSEFGTGEENIVHSKVRQSTPINNVINETLRLHSAVPLNYRTANCDTTLPTGGGVDGKEKVFVPKGTVVFIAPHLMQRSKKCWGDDAREFNPDRWNDGKSHSIDFIPFSAGPRICIGMEVALAEMSYALIRLLQTYPSIETDEEHRTKPLRENISLATRPVDGVWVRFEEEP